MSECLAQARLERLASGGAPETTGAEEAHLRACARCRSALSAAKDLAPFIERAGRMLREAAEQADSTAGAPGDAGNDGEILHGYRLLEEIGRGGQGSVWKAVHESSGRPAALKVIRLAGGPERARMRREARLASALRHPGIVAVYDCGALPDAGFAIAMEFVEGEPLDAWCARLRREPQAPHARRRRIVRVIVDVCAALHHAHQRGVIHRDLKPGNILVGPQDQPRVVDFGLAREIADGSGWTVTRAGEFTGTLAYAAPEQLTGSDVVGSPADIYALGVVLHESIGGRPPYEVSGPIERALGAILGPAPPLLRIGADGEPVDRDLATVISKAMAKEPARRYDSAASLRDDLERWLKGIPVRARRATAFDHARAFVKRRPIVSAAAFAALVSVTAFIVTLAILYRLADEAQRRFERLYLDANGAVESSNAATREMGRAVDELASELDALRLASERDAVNRADLGAALTRANLARAVALASAGDLEEAKRIAWTEALAPASIAAGGAAPPIQEIVSVLRCVESRPPAPSTDPGAAGAEADRIVALQIADWIERLRAAGMTATNEVPLREWASGVLQPASRP